MSFNRLKYDTCETKQDLKQSRGPGLYQINEPKLCQSCLPDTSLIISQKGADSINKKYPKIYQSSQVEVESKLRNITQPASRCPENKLSEADIGKCGSETLGLPTGSGIFAQCTEGNDLSHMVICSFPVEATRNSNPSSNLRSIGINRFNPLFMDPQDQVLFPGEYGVNTRLLSKDNHRPCVPRPLEQSPQLPLPYDGSLKYF